MLISYEQRIKNGKYMSNMYMTWKLGRKNMVLGINTLDTANLYANLNNSKKLSSNAAGDSSNKALIKQLQDTLLDNLAASYDKTDSKSAKKIDNEVKSLMSEADKDKSGGLSLKELSSIDTTNDSDQAKVVHDLISNFKTYDKDGDGQLSATEMKDALKGLKKQFSMQDIAKMAQENNDFSTSGSFVGNVQGNLSNSLAEKLISNYQSGDLSSSASSLSVAG